MQSRNIRISKMAKSGKRQIRRSAELSLLAYTILLLCLFGCAGGKSVENNYNRTTSEIMHDTLLHYVYGRDSVSTADSVYYKDSVIYVYRNDSVLVDRWHTRYVSRWRDGVKTDTVRAYVYRLTYKTDTITLTKTKTVYRDKELTKLQEVRMGLGDIFVVIVVILTLTYCVRKRLQ